MQQELEEFGFLPMNGACYIGIRKPTPLHGYHWERKMSSLCLMIRTTFSMLQQVMLKITTIEFVWVMGDLKNIVIFFIELRIS